MLKKEKVKLLILILSIIFLNVGVLVYCLLPELSDFRNSIYGSLISFVVLEGLILIVTLSKKINMPLLGKITVWSFGLLYVLLMIIDLGKIEALFFLLYSIVNVCISIYIYKKTDIGYRSIWSFGALSYFASIIFVLRVRYINGEMNMTFLITSLIMMVIVFVPCLIYGLVKYTIDKDLEKLICIPLIGLMFGFAIPWLTISSMNVYLDTSSPTFEEFVIIGKDVDAGARQVTTYEFEVKKDDTIFTIGVSEEVYYDYEINDKITLSIYKGLFNEPYYIYNLDDNKS